MIAGWRGCAAEPSLRAAPGTLGLFIREEEGSTDPDHFLIGSEFAHHHPESDGGYHMVLPPDWHAAAMAKGWAVPHPWAGRPTVSKWTVLVFAPRDETELSVIENLIQVAEEFARTG